MQDLLEYITRKITQAEISVDTTEENQTRLYTIKAPKAIFGMLIGKGGKTIRAIRAVARARAIIDRENVNIQLQETS